MEEQSTHIISISVVIPTCNSASTIARAIDSVLTQSYTAFQIIVVDDGSTDNTRDIIAKYEASVTCIHKATNTGSSDTRNTGIDAAKGDYIAFLDADDVWHKAKLRVVAFALQSRKDISLLYHPYTQDDLDNKPLPKDIHIYKQPFMKLLSTNLIATSCAIIRNDADFRFDTDMRYTEDYDLWLRISYKHKMFFIDCPLTQIFRPFTSPGGISEKRWRMRKGEMRAYAKLAKLHPAFVIVIPFLLSNSIAKHLYKIVDRCVNVLRRK